MDWAGPGVGVATVDQSAAAADQPDPRHSNAAIPSPIASHSRFRRFRGAPLLATDLAGLPPALVMLGGHDILHDEGLAYAQGLLAAGVPVTLVDYAALGHGFISMGGAVHAARLAIDQLASALKRALNP